MIIGQTTSVTIPGQRLQADLPSCSHQRQWGRIRQIGFLRSSLHDAKNHAFVHVRLSAWAQNGSITYRCRVHFRSKMRLSVSELSPL
jgi:hypothetical protein